MAEKPGPLECDAAVHVRAREVQKLIEEVTEVINSLADDLVHHVWQLLLQVQILAPS